MTNAPTKKGNRHRVSRTAGRGDGSLSGGDIHRRRPRLIAGDPVHYYLGYDAVFILAQIGSGDAVNRFTRSAHPKFAERAPGCAALEVENGIAGRDPCRLGVIAGTSYGERLVARIPIGNV